MSGQPQLTSGSVRDDQEATRRIHEGDLGCPAAPVNAISGLLGDLDLVLIMVVNPGFGGQQFIEPMLNKIRVVRNRIGRLRPGIDLESDGGVDLHTLGPAVVAGAREFVAGSSVFHAKDGFAAAVQGLIRNGSGA